MPSQILILTGMHRSGTSLLASVLQSAGVDIGKELLAPDARNKRGFFEDVDFYRFHERALARRGLTPFVGQDFRFDPTSEEREEARAIVLAREGQALWGWKDPRTCLFLEFWRELLPEARLLLVYRHPLDVLASLVRRGEPHIPGILEGLVAWEAYGAAIRRCHRGDPAGTVLCHAYGAIKNVDQLSHLLREKLGLPITLDKPAVDALYHPAELQRLPLTRTAHDVLRELQPESAGLYDDLEETADIPGERLAEAGAADPGLTALRAALHTQSGMGSSSSRRGHLMLLMSCLEPDLLEKYFEELAKYVRELEVERGQRQAWLDAVEADNRAKQEYIERQEANVVAQRSWIEALEADNRVKQEFIEKQEAHVMDQRRQIERFEATIRDIYQSRSWRWARRLAALNPSRLRSRPRAGEE